MKKIIASPRIYPRRKAFSLVRPVLSFVGGIRRCQKAVLFLALVTALALPVYVYASDISVTIDGRPVDFPVLEPLIVDGRTLVPVRGVFDSLGFALSWNELTRQATLANER